MADAFGRDLVALDHAERRTPVAAATPELLDVLLGYRRPMMTDDELAPSTLGLRPQPRRRCPCAFCGCESDRCVVIAATESRSATGELRVDFQSMNPEQSTRATVGSIVRCSGRIAQWLERFPYKEEVGGSSPAAPTTKS